jgi:signal transduction histidine kinase
LRAVLKARGAFTMAALESKNAGRVLALIVLVLMLPMLLIGYFYFSLAQVEIKQLESELRGSRVLQAAFPLHFSDTKTLTQKQLELIQRLEAGVISRGHQNFQLRWSTEHQSRVGTNAAQQDAIAKEGMSAYFVDIASDSGLAADSDLASYFLIDSVILTLPRLATDVQELGRQLHDLAMDRHDFDRKIGRILQLKGRAMSAQDRFEDSIWRSSTLGGDDQHFTVIKRENATLSQRISEMAGFIAQSGESVSAGNAVHVSQVQSASNDIKRQTLAIATPAFVELDRKLEARLMHANSKLISLSLLGFAAASIGIGLAAQMFRKTLTKLDRVEIARGEAVMAQADAERINDEIASLNRNLADKIKELQHAQNEIVKKGRMEQLGQLTATIAHELRNPLGSVRTSAYLINRKAGGKGLGIDEQISRIEKGVVRCDNIITQLLDFSRTKQITATPANLDSWLAGIVTEEANKLPANVQIDCVLGLDDISVPFDPARMQRAIINLLSNAVEAMTNKDANSNERANGYPHVWISTFKAGDEVAIRVKDNGPGIDPQVISKIREPLYTTKSFGTGLGIPAIEQIAAQHGGRLDITSQRGEGAEFTIFIPINQSGSEEPPMSAVA